MEDSTFDVTQFEAMESAVLDVLTPLGAPLMYAGKPVQIEVYGPGSAMYATEQAKVDTARRARAVAAAIGRASDETTEEIHKQNAARLAALTKQIINFPIPGGAQALYENKKLGYISDQVARFVEDWSRFLPPSVRSLGFTSGSELG